MKRFSIMLFFIALVTFLLSLCLFFTGPVPLQITEIPAFVSISKDIVGFDLNSSALAYGSVVRGSSSTKQISIQNDFPVPVRVIATFYGSISPFLEDSVDIELFPGETISMPFTLITRYDSPLGKYDGFVRILFYRVS